MYSADVTPNQIVQFRVHRGIVNKTRSDKEQNDNIREICRVENIWEQMQKRIY